MSSVAPSQATLGLLPALSITGIGSLPHTQQELGLQMALQVDVPYLPQMPTGSPAELMVPAALEGLPGLSYDAEGVCVVDRQAWKERAGEFSARVENALASQNLSGFEPSPQACRAWRPFIWEVENRKLAFAKVQLAGPCTVRWVTRTDDGAPASELPALDQQIYRLLLARSLSMVRALRRSGTVPVFFLDEPGLFAFNPTDARHLLALQELKLLAVALEREGALVGVHCCGNTRWEVLLGLPIQLLSLDVRLSLDALLEEKQRFREFVEAGRTLSLGIVPTNMDAEFRLEELVDSVDASLRATLPARNYTRALSRMVLTPACGLAMRTVSSAESLFAQVRQAQRRLRELASLPSRGSLETVEAS
jgi:hypothetical protein